MFKKLKSIFVIEDQEEASKNSNPKSNQQAKSNKSSKSAKGSATQPKYVPPTSGKPDEKFVNMLLGAIDKNNIEGFDYLEYKQSLQNLSNVEMDEETKYKSAMAMAKTMGATPQKLVTSANHYIKILTAEENKFLEAFKNQQSAQVNSRNQEISNLEKSINLKTKKIEELKKEIETEKKTLESKKTNINQAIAKVASTKDRFYLAYNIVVSQIKADLEKIKKYLA